MPKAQTGPVVYDEYETAQLIMKKFSFAYSSERLYVFTGPGYECLDKNELIALMKDSVPYELRRKKPSFWSSVVKNIEQESKIHISLDEIEHPKYEIVFKNGCFNVITKKMREATPEDYIVDFNDIEYDISRSHKDKYTNDFFETISGGKQKIKELLWSVLGAILSHHSEYKKFFYLFGVSNSGKSVFGELCEFLVGPKNCSHIPLADLCGKYSLAQLHGKTLNVSLDTPAFTLKNVGNLKMLTSGGSDIIESEKKFGKHVRVQSNHVKLLFASNNRLYLDRKEDAASFRQRVLIIPFLVPIPSEEQDKDLLKKLMAEKDYIIKKALNAYRKLLENNSQFPIYTLSEQFLDKWFPEIKEITNGGIEEFLCSDYIMKGIELEVTCKKLYKGYCDFCLENDIMPVVYNVFINNVRQKQYIGDTRI